MLHYCLSHTKPDMPLLPQGCHSTFLPKPFKPIHIKEKSSPPAGEVGVLYHVTEGWKPLHPWEWSDLPRAVAELGLELGSPDPQPQPWAPYIHFAINRQPCSQQSWALGNSTTESSYHPHSRQVWTAQNATGVPQHCTSADHISQGLGIGSKTYPGPKWGLGSSSPWDPHQTTFQLQLTVSNPSGQE